MHGAVELVPHNLHRVAVDGRELLFHVPTTSLFELDALTARAARPLPREAPLSRADVAGEAVRRSRGHRDVVEVLGELLDLGIIVQRRPERRRDAHPCDEARHVVPAHDRVLNVNTGCNLAARYCYKEDLDHARRRARRWTSRRRRRRSSCCSRDAQNRARVQRRVLRRRAAHATCRCIRDVVAYAEAAPRQRASAWTSRLTTNATLLNDEHRRLLGRAPLRPHGHHGRTRRRSTTATARRCGGNGTYDVVARRSAMLRRALSLAAGRRARHAHSRRRPTSGEIHRAPHARRSASTRSALLP